jgi:hypothetical protein
MLFIPTYLVFYYFGLVTLNGITFAECREELHTLMHYFNVMMSISVLVVALQMKQKPCKITNSNSCYNILEMRPFIKSVEESYRVLFVNSLWKLTYIQLNSQILRQLKIC